MTVQRRIALIGFGKMGRAVATLALERGHEVVATLDGARTVRSGAITREALGEPDVAIEFTQPAAALPNVLACVRAHVPVVVGTTGWYDQLPVVERAVHEEGGSVLYAPNFSLGVAIFLELAAQAGRAMQDQAQFDVQLLETHHRAKRDAPSGTAAALAAAVRRTSGREVPITSIRVGAVPGTHELLFDAPFEQIRLTHEARDRRVFADGALSAAEWLVGRQGLFTMRDMLHLPKEA